MNNILDRGSIPLGSTMISSTKENKMSLETYRNKETKILELFSIDERGDFVNVSGDFISPTDLISVLNETLTKAMDNANKLIDLEEENEKLKKSHEQMVNGTYNNKEKMEDTEQELNAAVTIITELKTMFPEVLSYLEELTKKITSK